MPEPFDFAQKIALVAGGTGGLGGLIAAELRGRGCIVTTVARSPRSDSAHISADLRSPDAISAVMSSIVERHGAIDIVVNAMGVVAFGTVDATSIDTIEELFLTNTFAHIFLMKEALKCARQGSVLVGISGVIAEQNLPGMSVYGSSKAAVRSFNEALTREARRSGVRVIDARPPHTETGLATRAIAGDPPRMPAGLAPIKVAQRIVQAIADGETDLPSTAFSDRPIAN
jgi:cyclic-di-GMP-binding biofilm dispersal mediator protein